MTKMTNVAYYRSQQNASLADWHWNKEDACQFAKKRYTMASVWFEPGKAYSTYGLEDALVWFKTQDLRKPLAVSEINEKSYEKQACESLSCLWQRPANTMKKYAVNF